MTVDEVISLAATLSDHDLPARLVAVSATEPREVVERGLRIALKLGILTPDRLAYLSGELQRLADESAKLAEADPEVAAQRQVVADLQKRETNLAADSPAGIPDVARSVVMKRQEIASMKQELEHVIRERQQISMDLERADRLLTELTS